MNSPHLFDWRNRLASDHSAPSMVDSRRRLYWLLAGFVLALGVIATRALWIEVHHGPEYRRLAKLPVLRETRLAAKRGRILARDGTVLAADRPTTALLLHYRTIENPPDPAWLRAQARRRLTPAERRIAGRLDAEVARVRVQQVDLHRRLAQLTGMELSDWNAARQRVQRRVERIASSVNRRHEQRRQQESQSELLRPTPPRSFFSKFREAIGDAVTPDNTSTRRQEIVVAEELAYHVLVASIPETAASHIRTAGDKFPGVQLQENSRRHYPAQTLAAHVVGHLGGVGTEELQDGPYYQAGDLAGRMGIERAFETHLRGEPGHASEQTDHRGQLLTRRVVQPPKAGGDVRLTIDAQLQVTAETLLDAALRRQRATDRQADPAAGGAIVVLDCQRGDVLACASAPRFDPNALLPGNSAAAESLLTASDRPLFDRATRMAIPPGSVMKTITAIALLESGTVTADQDFFCQGYLNNPRQLRCAVYQHFGIGHDRIQLPAALAESCNVYFFHHAPRMGAAPLVHWARRFGLGSQSGISLPAESAGSLPTPDARAEQQHPWRDSDTRALSIGQSTLTTTPLQIARAMSGIATGQLVTPRIIFDDDRQQSIAAMPVGAQPLNLEAVRRGMRRAVSHPDGTAHRALARLPVTVAAKTGTAETGRSGDHAWIAGYAPADAPKITFAVALEHAGGGGVAAGPVARQILARLVELRYLAPEGTRPLVTAEPESGVSQAGFNRAVDE